MKVVLLAGGFGSRISEESHTKPKPMIDIGTRPILWHIMKHYYHSGFDEFVICAGYKGNMIKQYFMDYYMTNCDLTFDFTKGNDIKIEKNFNEKWKITVIDTGLNTMTGGRIKRIKEYVNDETFMLTYGDGLSNVNLQELLKVHKQSKAIATITSVKPNGRFGVVQFDSKGQINHFSEKNQDEVDWINGGFMVLEPEIFDYIQDDATVFEKSPLENVAKEGKLFTYTYKGFWQCMDTMKDKMYLEELWNKKDAPWKIW